MFGKFKYQYIGYVEGRVREKNSFFMHKERHLLYVNGYGKRKVKVVNKLDSWYESTHSQNMRVDVDTWLKGGEFPEEMIKAKVRPINNKFKVINGGKQ